jgi:hypothetical protein
MFIIPLYGAIMGAIMSFAAFYIFHFLKQRIISKITIMNTEDTESKNIEGLVNYRKT